MAVCAFLGVMCAAVQSPAFDVASLKPSPPPKGDTYNANLGSIRHGELTMTNCTLADILRFAFRITNAEQIVGPDWIGNKSYRFDVLAKAPPGASDDEVRLMLRKLAQERFKIVSHTEPRELSVLVLSVGKKGVKIPEAQPVAETGGNGKWWMGDIESKHASMQMLATILSRYLRETVVDETGLKGYYEVTLKWAREAPAGSATFAGASSPLVTQDDSLPSIFEAVKPLGLQLTPHKRIMDVIVVDSALRDPVAN